MKWQTRVFKEADPFFSGGNPPAETFPLLIENPFFLCYTPSLPLADAKWSPQKAPFFSIYAVYSVFMRSLES